MVREDLQADLKEILECLKCRREYQAIDKSFPFRGKDKVEVTYDPINDCLSIGLWGGDLILCKDGTWYLDDTSGG